MYEKHRGRRDRNKRKGRAENKSENRRRQKRNILKRSPYVLVGTTHDIALFFVLNPIVVYAFPIRLQLLVFQRKS